MLLIFWFEFEKLQSLKSNENVFIRCLLIEDLKNDQFIFSYFSFFFFFSYTLCSLFNWIYSDDQVNRSILTITLNKLKSREREREGEWEKENQTWILFFILFPFFICLKTKIKSEPDSIIIVKQVISSRIVSRTVNHFDVKVSVTK